MFVLVALPFVYCTGPTGRANVETPAAKTDADKSDKDDKADKADKSDGPLVPRPTVKVEQGRFSTSVTARGTVESDSRSEVEVQMKGWPGPLEVLHAVEHGAKVKKDDVLLKFDPEKLTKAVETAREERALASLTIKLAELDLPLAKLQLPLDLLAAERRKQQSEEDLERFLKTDKAHDIESAQFMLKSSEFSLNSAKDELAQLEKMYRDKDLTEETEQIILKRYRFSLESAEFQMRSSQLYTERTLKIDLPRREEAVKLAAAKAKIDWDRAREDLPLQLRQKELTLEKQRFDDKRAQEKLADLEKDLTLMTIKSPAAGMVYHGRYHRGQWSGPGSASFLKGGSLPINDVVLTIVSTGRLFVHLEVEEKEIGEIKEGQAVRFAPTRSPHAKLAGKVHRVAAIPEGGKFQVVVALADESPAGIVPGLTGNVKIVTASKEKALTIPSSAVFEDEEAETHYVYLPGQPPQKKTVKIGLISGDKTEIVEGLAAGDEILASKP
jgi:multidrug efflux pump subunit AcrA (membrane-fusion protein)